MEQKEAGGAIPTVQWFPGHMAKTKRLIQGNLKSVDVVIELLDARVPTSSANPLIREIVGEKPRLVALNKADLADEAQTKKWIACFLPLSPFRSEYAYTSKSTGPWYGCSIGIPFVVVNFISLARCILLKVSILALAERFGFVT